MTNERVVQGMQNMRHIESKKLAKKSCQICGTVYMYNDLIREWDLQFLAALPCKVNASWPSLDDHCRIRSHPGVEHLPSFEWCWFLTVGLKFNANQASMLTSQCYHDLQIYLEAEAQPVLLWSSNLFWKWPYYVENFRNMSEIWTARNSMPTSNPEIQGYTVNPASLDLQLWSLQHGSALEWALLGVAGDAPLTLVHPILDRLANKKQFDHPETFWKWRLVEAQPKKNNPETTTAKQIPRVPV